MSELLGVVGTFSMEDVDVIRDVDFDVLYEDEPDWSPLATFMTRISGTQTVKNTKYEWQENVLDKFAVSSAAIPSTTAGAETTNVVINSANMRVGDVLFHAPTGQQFQITTRVSKTTTTTTVKLTKIPITEAGDAISGTPSFRVLPNFMLEGGYYPIGVGTKPDFYFNYTQLNATTATITKTMKEVTTYHGSHFEEDVMYALHNLQCGQERTILFGKGIQEARTFTNEESNVSDGTFRSTQGLFDYITSIGPYSGDLDKPTLNAFCGGKVWGPRNSGSRKKLFVSGANVMQAINDMSMEQYRVMSGENVFGLDIQAYKLWGNRIGVILEEREFSNDTLADDYADTMLAIEPDLINIMQLGSQFIQLSPLNAGPRDIEGLVWRSEFGLKTRGRGKHHRLTKVA
jgi:hypothetical protein